MAEFHRAGAGHTPQPQHGRAASSQRLSSCLFDYPTADRRINWFVVVVVVYVQGGCEKTTIANISCPRINSALKFEVFGLWQVYETTKDENHG